MTEVLLKENSFLSKNCFESLQNDREIKNNALKNVYVNVALKFTGDQETSDYKLTMMVNQSDFAEKQNFILSSIYPNCLMCLF